MNRRQFVESLIAAAALPIDGVRGSFTPDAGAAQAPVTSVTPPRRPAPALWYGRAASKWVEALPVGNGRLGAMVFGDVGVERLQINDDTLWSGGPGGWDTPGAKVALAEVRRLALAGDYAAADKAARGLMGAFTQSYLPLGDVWLTSSTATSDATTARAAPRRRGGAWGGWGGEEERGRAAAGAAAL